jgi:hypothetical protein
MANTDWRSALLGEGVEAESRKKKKDPRVDAS